MNATDYDKQAEAFLERFGVKFRATEYPKDMQTAPEWAKDGNSGTHKYPHGLRYRVVFEREGEPPLSFDYWGSIADREIIERSHQRWANPSDKTAAAKARPSAYDVLACVSSDIYCPDDFDEFCADYGYDNDSIKALDTWKRCAKFAAELRQFFPTDEEREALAEIN